MSAPAPVTRQQMDAMSAELAAWSVQVRMARRVELIEDKRFSDHVQEMLNFHGLDAEKVRRILSSVHQCVVPRLASPAGGS